MKSQTLLTDYPQRIVINPVRSRKILLLIISLHLVALWLLLFIDLAPWLLSVIAGLIVFNQYQYFSSDKSQTHRLSLRQGEAILLKMDNGSWQEIDVIESFVTPWLIVLKVRTLKDFKLFSLVYATDSVDMTSFRRLRIYLNLYL
jgi:hypothetical protein